MHKLNAPEVPSTHDTGIKEPYEALKKENESTEVNASDLHRMRKNLNNHIPTKRKHVKIIKGY